jgi:hypothetical protein
VANSASRPRPIAVRMLKSSALMPCTAAGACKGSNRGRTPRQQWRRGAARYSQLPTIITEPRACVEDFALSAPPGALKAAAWQIVAATAGAAPTPLVRRDVNGCIQATYGHGLRSVPAAVYRRRGTHLDNSADAKSGRRLPKWQPRVATGANGKFSRFDLNRRQLPHC